MDKNVETQFSSDFWRLLNYQYFTVETPVQLNVTKQLYKKSKSSSYFFSSQLFKFVNLRNS